MKKLLLILPAIVVSSSAFSQTGNVGIGTSSPQGKLDVYGDIFGLNEYSFTGYSESIANWDYSGLQINPAGNSVSDDSWYIQSNSSNWSRGLLSRRRFSRTPGLTIEYEAYMEATLGGAVHYMVGFTDGNTTNYSYCQTPSNLMYHNNTSLSVYENCNSMGTNYSFDTRNAWWRFKIILKGAGADYYVFRDNTWNLVLSTSTNSSKYLRVLISAYNNRFYVRNMRVFQQNSDGEGPGSGYIKNQIGAVQPSSNYWISGIGRAPQYQLNNANTALTQGSGNSLRVTTNSGYTEIGAQNTGWSHFYTDLPRYYFNKGITVDEGFIGSYNEDLSLQTSGTTRITALNSNGYVGIGTTVPATLLQVTGGHSTTRARMTLPAGNNGGGTGEVNLQLWVSEPNVTWDAAGIGTNVNNDGGSPAGFSRLNTALGQSYIRFITNGGAMAFNTTNNAGTYYQTMYMVNGNVGIGTTSPGEHLHATSNIRSDGIVYWGNGLVRTETRHDAGLQGNAGARSGFYETSAPAPGANWPPGTSSWWHLLDVRHSNNTNNYALQIAGSFFDQTLWYRKTNNNPAQAWSKFLTPSNTYGSNIQSAVSTTDVATTSSSYNAIPDMSITFTPVHSTVYVTFSAAGNFTGTYSAAQFAHFRIVKDGIVQKGGSCSVGEFDNYDGGHNTWNIHFTYPVAVTPNVATTIRVDWAYLRYFTNQTLWIRPSVEPVVHHRHLYIMD